LIVQDDCSNDSTVEILRSYQDKLPFKLHINDKNIGYAKNFESVLQKANGDYICICDQDDIWDHDKISILIESIGDSSLIYSNSLFVDEKGESLGRSLLSGVEDSIKDIDSSLSFLFSNSVSAHAMMFKKDLLEHLFPFPKNIYFDAWIAATAVNFGGLKYLDQTLVLYRQHTTNTLGNVKKTKVGLFAKIAKKVEKKQYIMRDTVEKLDELLCLNGLPEEDKNKALKLKKFCSDFDNRWFSFSMFYFLNAEKDTFFKITRKNRTNMALKKALGKKFYTLFPFL